MKRLPLPAARLLALALSWLFSNSLGAVPIDDNGNGMSDIWEAAYGRNLAPEIDTDGDGRNNLQESVAGTDPNNAASVLSLESFTLENGNVARLRWPSIAGKRYQIQVSFDLKTWQDSGVPLVGTGSLLEANLPLATTFLTGKTTISRWTNMASNAGLAAVRTNITNNVAPSETGVLTTLETPPTAPNQDNFGQWIRGWIVPPTSGSYTFWIASDDASEFYLSPNSNAAAKVKQAFTTSYTNFRQWTKYPSQQSIPITLSAGQSYYFEALHKEGTGGDHVSIAWTGPDFSTPTIISGAFLASSADSLATQATRGMWFRAGVSDVDSDGDGVPDADEMLLGYDPNSATTVPRVGDAASIRSALAAQNVITVGASQARAYEAGLQEGRLTFFRSGNLDPLTIRYSVAGTAAAGADYVALSGSVVLPVGKTSVSVPIVPLGDDGTEPAETVTVQVQAAVGYQPGSPAQATVTIDDAPDILYVANLRPDSAVRSGGYGTVALNVAGNAVFGNLSVSFGNLLAPQIRTELYISSTGNSGASVLNLPAGQLSGMRWNFDPVEGATRGDILQALGEGRLYARITSTAVPGGEIFGRFTAQLGWQTMPVPPAPPTLPMAPLLASDASRFLVQATYGPTQMEIDRLQSVGISTWLNEQMAATPTLHLPAVKARRAELLARSADADDGWQTPRQEAWWQAALVAPDQLRQRMALALSEIFVVSDIGVLDGSHEGITNYYDLLVTNAFGNYRDLLEKITLSPIMGQYLSMVRNQKPNKTTGAEPDENYARECMQLFSIGLSQLNLDGSLKLGANGMPIPTYTQSDIVGLAHVFTGWAYQTPTGGNPNFLYGARDEMNPMIEFSNYHDTAQKTILNNTIIPAGQTMSQDLKVALDTLFNHPNTAPFIARQLIQRFVSSNPSPGYIYRVASIFNNNGSGVRGDLGATLKAVLLDYEARSPDLFTDEAHGKQKEPIIRMAHLLRALKAAPPKPGDSRFFLDLQYSLSSQAALKSPSVFNFFQPGYLPPGTLASNGLYGPEFQITSETSVINQDNNQHAAIFWGIWTREKDAANANYTIRLNLADQLAILNRTGATAAQNQAALLDNLNLLLLNGRMSPGLRQNILSAYAALPTWFTSAQNQADRVNIALWIIAASPEFAIQK